MIDYSVKEERCSPLEMADSSGPILHTVTRDGIFRIWGCVIDEPHCFSLWATIDAHATLPSYRLLTTLFITTQVMSESKAGTKDIFVTIFTDGSIYETVVKVGASPDSGSESELIRVL